MKLKIISVVGARPNFMKMAPVHKALSRLKNDSKTKIEHKICHTGQHYDANMNKVFFEDLELPEPDYYLGVGSGSHAEQTAKIMIEFEKVLLNEKPDLIIVFGDVNSTIACSLVASKLGVKIAHVESGLRSLDRSMPEEINRILTDHLADYLFVTEKNGVVNLKAEGIAEDKIFFVGNTMIDSLVNYLPKAEKSNILANLDLCPQKYSLVTLHRPSNVDDKDNLMLFIKMLNSLSTRTKIVFPVHPRTKAILKNLNLILHPDLLLIEPVGFIDFLALMKNAALVITDSGGIQEETTYLGVPCITVRENTERPVTVYCGTNYLTGTNLAEVENTAVKILNGEMKSSSIPELWDGKTAERIVDKLVNIDFVLNQF